MLGTGLKYNNITNKDGRLAYIMVSIAHSGLSRINNPQTSYAED